MIVVYLCEGYNAISSVVAKTYKCDYTFSFLCCSDNGALLVMNYEKLLFLSFDTFLFNQRYHKTKPYYINLVKLIDIQNF